MHVDGGLLQFTEQSMVISRLTTTKSYLPFEPDLQHLTLWYTFESWTDSIADLSFFGNNGIISAHISVGATNGPDKGYGLTMAYGFDGVQQNITALDNSTLKMIPSTGSFTITGGTNGTGTFTKTSFTVPQSSLGFSLATLIYPATYAQTISGMNRYVYSKVNDYNNMSTLFFDPSGFLHFWIYVNGVSYSVVTTQPIFPATWNWVVITFNNQTNTPSIYINGFITTTITDIPTEQPGLTGDFAHAQTDLFIGSNSGNDGFFQGYMSDFRFYQEKVLLASEVLALATNYYTITTIPFGGVSLIGLGTIN